MKNEQEEHSYTSHLPESKKKIIRWPHRFKKNLRSYLSTETGLSSFVACLSILIVTVILSTRYLVADNFITANLSTRDIVAERTLRVEDTEETERLRYEAKQLVMPIYKRQIGVDRLIMDRLIDLMENIQSIRENSSLTDEHKTAAMEKLLSQKELVRPEVLRTLLFSNRWTNIYDAAVETAEDLISKGVTSDEYNHKRVIIVRQALRSRFDLLPEEEEAIVFLVGNKLRPTLMIDEKSTEEARDIAASHVKPVIEVYNKGDIIVKKGDRISDLQRAALHSQGHFISKNRWLSVIGVAILSVVLLSTLWGYLSRFERSTFFKPAYSGLLATVIIAAVLGLTLLSHSSYHFAIEIFPVVILSLIVCIFTHPRIAIFTTLMVLFLCGLALKIPLETLSVLVISSMGGIFILARKPIPKDRNDLILAGLAAGVCQGVIILALSFIYEPILSIGQLNLFYRVWMGIISGLFAGVITLGVLPLIESMFKLVTPYTLLELGNHDRPMLRRMQMEAPGTFHHSIMVATLAEAAAEAIGANPILTRVGALYHDIGKIKRPLFFVENQAYFGAENPHDKLTPRLSKMVITAHARDGIEMAKQLGLPKALMRFMPEHHGTLAAGYFYNKAVLQEGEENVNKAQFRYPGPKPQSKETAIVMLADACESAVRSLKNPTFAQVEDRVDKIIRQRVDDGQFSECAITFQDIQQIRDTFVRILRGIQHYRIEYQQNMLEELGKKPLTEGIKQLSHSLKTIQGPAGTPNASLTPAPLSSNGGEDYASDKPSSGSTLEEPRRKSEGSASA